MQIACLLSLLTTLAFPAAAAPHLDLTRGPISLPLEARRTPSLTKRAISGAVDTLADPVFTSYHVNVSVGTPPQTLTLIIDAGTPDLILEAGGSDFFPFRDGPAFLANQSSTFAPAGKDNATQPYYNVSVMAATDTVTVGGMTVEKQPIAITPGLRTIHSGSGVLGLGLRDPTFKDTTPLIRALAARWSEPVVGVYMKRHDWVTGYSFSGPMQLVPGMGELSLGGLNSSYYTGDVKYMNVVNSSSWSLELGGIKVDGKEVQSNFTLGDSKEAVAPIMSLSYGRVFSNVQALPEDIANAMHSEVPGAQLFTYLLAGRWNQTMTVVPCNTTSVISFTFGGVEYPMQPSDWIVKLGDVCFSTILALNRTEVKQNSFPLATPFQQTVYTALKFSDPPQIGFAKLAADLPRANATQVAEGAGGQGETGWPSGVYTSIPTPTGNMGGGGGGNSAAKAHLAPVGAVLFAGLATLPLF